MRRRACGPHRRGHGGHGPCRRGAAATRARFLSGGHVAGRRRLKEDLRTVLTCTAAEPGVTWAPPLLPPPVPRALGLKDIRIDLVLACFLLVSGLWLGLTGSVVGRNRVCRLLSGGKGAHASRERFPSLSLPSPKSCAGRNRGAKNFWPWPPRRRHCMARPRRSIVVVVIAASGWPRRKRRGRKKEPT